MRDERQTERILAVHSFTHPKEFPSLFVAPTKLFVAMLICDASRFDGKEICELSRKLIDSGCACLCCWGPGCERVHDLFDMELVAGGLGRSACDTIMTTWHTEDSLKDFVEYAMWFAEPTVGNVEQCGSVVAVVIADEQTADVVRNVSADQIRKIAGSRAGGEKF